MTGRGGIRTRGWRLGPLTGWLACCGFAWGAVGQGADPPPVVKRLLPAGGTAGATVVVKAEGTFPRWPVQAWTDRPGTTWKPLEEKGAFEVAIAAEDSLGLHRVRLFDAAGAAVVRRFLVGAEPETAEVEPNDSPSRAGAASALPLTINGALEKAADVDCFSIPLEAGQTLVASLAAHGGLGSPVDAVLELVGETGGYLARNLDARGLDPRIVFTARRSGRVVVRVYGFPADPNQTIGLAGASDYVYRLTLATGPIVAAALPSAVAAEGTTRVRPLGWNLPGDPPARDLVAAPGVASLPVSFPGLAGVVELPVVAAAVATAAAADEAPPPALVPPAVISGWFSSRGGAAVARITARKDAPLLVTVEAHRAGSEADPTLEIRDPAGGMALVKTDRDAAFSWKPSADGDYTLVLRDPRGAAGPGCFFRVSVKPERPELRATTEADSVSGKVGGPLEVAIAVERLHGWKEPVEFFLVDPPAGISAAPVVSAAEGDTAKKVALSIAAAEPFAGPVRIAARRAAPAGEAVAANAVGETVAAVLAGKEKLPVVWITAVAAGSEPEKKP